MVAEGEGAATGRRGEDAALRRYTRAGYALVARNWRCRLGEIDLILARGATLVVCEVKARRGAGLGGPYEAVGARKQAKLRMLAEAFLASAAGTALSAAVAEVRFDVASVIVSDRGDAVHVFEDAF
ncbi:MAG TPA: YraN family protein [Actinomycetota bacterium]|nr:YraN family protein [Actinomycetota bacterium]